MTTQSKIALGILGAIATGVAIGMLVAPEKGSEIRKKIKKTTGSWADGMRHLFSRAKDIAAEVKNDVKGKAREIPALG